MRKKFFADRKLPLSGLCGGDDRTVMRRLKEGVRDCGGWNQEGDGAEDPHNDRAEDLVGEGLDLKGVGVGDVVRVDRAVTEGEKGRKRCVDQVGAYQIEKDVPVAPSACGGPGAQDAPPKEQRGEEEADVLEVVAVFVFEGEVVGGGNMPEEKDRIHQEPCDRRENEQVRKSTEGFGPKQRSGDWSAHEGRQAAKERDNRKTEENQRRDERHKNEVLDHVGTEQHVGKRIQRRADGDPKCGQARKKRQESRRGELSGARFTQGNPAAEVDRGRQKNCESKTEGERPIGHYRLERVCYLEGERHALVHLTGWGGR